MPTMAIGAQMLVFIFALVGAISGVPLQDRHELMMIQQQAAATAPHVEMVNVHGGRRHRSMPKRHWAEKLKGGLKNSGGVAARATMMLEAKEQPVVVEAPNAAEDSGVPIPTEHFLSAIYYINLDSRTDRRDAMEEITNGIAGLPVHRIPAIETDLVTARNDDRFKKYIGDRKMNPYLVNKASDRVRNFVVSVNLAHMLTYEKVLASHTSDLDKPVLVLEDDVTLAEGWEEAIASAIAKVPEDYDLVRFSTWGETRNEDKIGDAQIDSNIFKAVAPFRDTQGRMYYVGMHAVVIRPRSIPKVLKFLKGSQIDDIDASVTAFGNELKSYVVQEPHITVSEMGTVSDHPYVSNERAANW